MPRNLHAIAAALNAYPWTTGRLTAGPDDALSYCAIGALLRYAGVPHNRIASGAAVPVIDLDRVYGPLLSARYGISGADTLQRIVAANDTAQSRAQALWRVLGLASGTLPPDSFAPHAGTTYVARELPPAA